MTIDNRKETVRKRIANNLKKARKEAKFSQENVAKVLHIGRSVVSKLETQKRDLSLEEAAKFSNLYKKSIYYFLGD